jgi:Flp pilus assembly protein TadD
MKGDVDAVISDSTRAIQLNRRDAWAYNNRGNALCKKGEMDSAPADFTTAIGLDAPARRSILQSRGGALFAERL